MKLHTKQDIETGILMALTLLLLAWVWQDWTFILFAPVLFRALAFLWFGITRMLGYIVPKVLLTVLFLVLVIPVGLFRKWMGKDSLQLNDFKKERDSILKDRNHTYQPDDLNNPF